MKKLRRILTVVIILVVVLIATVAILTMTSIGMRSVVLPIVNSVQPWHVSMDSWRFIPWSGVKAENIDVTGPGTKVTCDSLSIDYAGSSLMSDTPVIHLIDIEGVGVTHIALEAAKAKAAKKGEKPSQKKAEKKPSEKDTGKPQKPFKIPLVIEKMRIADVRVTYIDQNGITNSIQDFGIAARDIGTENDAQLIAKGVINATQKDQLSATLPFACELTHSPSSSSQPVNLFLTVSNTTGYARDVDISPYSADFHINLEGLGRDALHITRLALYLNRNGKPYSSLLTTGVYYFSSQKATAAVSLDTSPNRLWDALVNLPQYDISRMHTELNASIAWNGKEQTVACTLKSAIKDIAWRTLPAAPHLYSLLSLDTHVDLNDKVIDIQDLSTIVSEENTPRMKVSINKPVHFSWDTTSSSSLPAFSDAEIKCIIDSFPLRRINAFLKPNGLKLRGGDLSAAVNTTLKSADTSIHTRGAFILNDIALKNNQSIWSDLDITTKVDIAVHDLSLIDITRMTTLFSADNKAAGSISLGGSFDKNTGSNAIACVISHLKSDLFRPAIDPARENRNLDGLELNAQIRTYKKDVKENIQDVRGDISFINTLRRTENDWRTIILSLNLQTTPKEIILPRCSLSTTPAQWPDNEISISGNYITVPTNVISSLRVYSKHFDATALMDTFMPARKEETSPAPSTPDQASQPAEEKPKEPKEEPPAAPPTQHPLHVKAHINELIAREMNVKPLSFDLIISNTFIRFLTHNMHINDGPIALFAQLDKGVPGYTYAADISLTNVPLAPLVNTFAPNMKDKFAGASYANVTLKGAGMTENSAPNNLIASLDAGMRKGRLTRVPILDDVARVIRLDDLSDLPVGSAVLKCTARNGVATIPECDIFSKTLKAGITGTVPFKDEMDLQMNLALSPGAISEILSNSVYSVGIPVNKTLEKYVPIPTPIVVRGTLKEPKVRVSPTKFIAAVIKEIGGGALDTITDIIPGGGEVKDTVKEGIKLFEGMFNDMKKQPAAPEREPYVPKRSR